jgi:hypothetical protein
MTIGALTILAVTGSVVVLKLGVMALVVVSWARTVSSERQLFQQRSAISLPVKSGK